MHYLELKIPPPVVTIISGLLIWLLNQYWPQWQISLPMQFGLGVLSAIIGTSLGITALFQFRQARTTAHPPEPKRTRRIVTNGIYRFTRNPMYLGIVFTLLAWALWLGNLAGLLGLIFFMVYLTYFQIKPEERILQEKFGSEYILYKQNVRRWL